MQENYDYIVVGAGSAGCVIATRLIEELDASVLLVEAGKNDKNNLFVEMPGGSSFAMKGDHMWQYKTNPEPALNNRSLTVPQGKLVGGGSSVNAMIYVRGNHQDYDDWKNKYGCAGWGYSDVLPYFKKAENNEVLANHYHGSHGPLTVNDARLRHPISLAYLKAAQQKGYEYVHDFNGEKQAGVGFYQTTTDKGQRASTAHAYLNRVRDNPKLTLLTETDVHKVLFEGNKAVGIEYHHKHQIHKAMAKQEIIVTAGSIGTAKLLLVSGVGPKKHLEDIGVNIVADNPNVGKNFHDHLYITVSARTPSMPALMENSKGWHMISTGIEWLLHKEGVAASNLFESGGFFDLDGDNRVDTQIHTFPAILPSEGNVQDINVRKLDLSKTVGITLKVGYVQPKSRGEVLLRSSDPHDMPIIKGNYLSAPEDVDGFLRAVKLALSLFEAPALKEIITERVDPNPSIQTDDELKDYIRNTAETIYHPIGTCRMGANPENSAVDLELKLRGVTNLRVADGSVIPQITSANTNNPIIMIAERAVEFILKDYSG